MDQPPSAEAGASGLNAPVGERGANIGTCRFSLALSGEGARRFGGRWNPPLLFPAIYLADSARACMVEVERAANAASTTAEKMLEAAYRLHTIDVAELSVLDLRTPEAQDAVGLEIDDIFCDDWAACQAVGLAAWLLHMQGILAPAAGGVGLVITAYEQRTRPGQIAVRESVDLTPEVYRLLRNASGGSE
jgi:RES domain-containing protein